MPSVPDGCCHPIRVAVLTGAMAIAGCGSGVHATHSSTQAFPSGSTLQAGRRVQLPAGVVASVAGHPIMLVRFEQAYSAAVRGASAVGGPVPVDPPSYARCAAALRGELARLQARLPSVTGRSRARLPTPSASQLRRECAQRRTALIQSVMTQLIESEWTELEARDEHVTVSETEVAAALARERASFRTARLFHEYLARSGQTEATLAARIRLELLTEALARRRVGATPGVSQRQVAAYFDAHRAQFALPQRRDLELILTRTRAQAEQARQAVERGQSWGRVAAVLSIDPATRASGGMLRDAVQGSLEPAVGSLAFAARPGAIVGPVKGIRGWYLIRVVAVIPATQPRLPAFSAQIRRLLAEELAARRASAANRSYENRWRSRTLCRPGYIVALCANASTGLAAGR